MAPRTKRQARTTRSKPYRTAARTKFNPSETRILSASPVCSPSPSTQFEPSVGQDLPSRHGYPTHAEFLQILDEYMSSLHSRKAAKALIDRETYHKIYDTLRYPDDVTIENAQFRFWVRKMFRLQHSDDASPVLVNHENRPVAIKEDLYTILCHCHSLSQHGGRDRTCSVSRSMYSYVPKVLVAKFVTKCPTCAYRRSGDPSYLPLVEEREEESTEDKVESGEMVEEHDMGMLHFGPGPQYPMSESPPPWLHLTMPRPHYLFSTSSTQTSTSGLPTPDSGFMLPLPPATSMQFDDSSAGPAFSQQNWDPVFHYPLAPLSSPPTANKHRLPGIAQLIGMESADSVSYPPYQNFYANDDMQEENLRLPPLMTMLSDPYLSRWGGECSDVPIDPVLLGEGGTVWGYKPEMSIEPASSHTRSSYTDIPALTLPSQTPITHPVPVITITSERTRPNLPPLDIAKASALCPSSIPASSESSQCLSVSPLRSDLSNLLTGSSLGSSSDASCGERRSGRRDKGKGKMVEVEQEQEQDKGPETGRKLRLREPGGVVKKRARVSRERMTAKV